MSAYSRITTMDIHISKTLAIPLGDKCIEETRDEMQDPRYDDLPQYTWAAAGKFLGFIIGPGAKDTSWIAPIENIKNGSRNGLGAKSGCTFPSVYTKHFYFPPYFSLHNFSTHPTSPLHPSRARKSIAADPEGWCSMDDFQHVHNVGSKRAPR